MLSAGLVTTVGTSLLTAVPAKAAEEPPPPALQGILERNGAPVSGEIVAVLWPNAATLASLSADAEVPLLPIASGQTGADGTYELTIDPATIPAEYRGPDSQIDVDVTVADATSQATSTLSLKPATAIDPSADTGRWVDGNATELDLSVQPSLDVDLVTGAFEVSSIPAEAQ